MYSFRFPIALLLLALCSGCSSGARQDRAFDGWQVMVTHEGKSDMLCYAGESPANSTGSLEQRKAAPYLMATRRPSGKIEISASGGYDFMPGSKVELAAGNHNFSLFHRGATAWARGDAADREITEALKSAQTIELRGVSNDGLTSIDHYAPGGFTGAVARIRELCP